MAACQLPGDYSTAAHPAALSRVLQLVTDGKRSEVGRTLADGGPVSTSPGSREGLGQTDGALGLCCPSSCALPCLTFCLLWRMCLPVIWLLNTIISQRLSRLADIAGSISAAALITILLQAEVHYHPVALLQLLGLRAQVAPAAPAMLKLHPCREGPSTQPACSPQRPGPGRAGAIEEGSCVPVLQVWRRQR
jgi:hypothetical protein